MNALHALFVATGMYLSSPTSHVQPETQFCQADLTDPETQATLRRVRQRASDPSEAYALSRESVLKIPRLAESDVQLVSDESICQQALASYDAVVPLKDSTRVRRVYVVRVGMDYVVADPAEHYGGWLTAIVVSSSFVLKSAGPFEL